MNRALNTNIDVKANTSSYNKKDKSIKISTGSICVNVKCNFGYWFQSQVNWYFRRKNINRLLTHARVVWMKKQHGISQLYEQFYWLKAFQKVFFQFINENRRFSNE